MIQYLIYPDNNRNFVYLYLLNNNHYECAICNKRKRKKTAVQIPLKEWENLQNSLKKISLLDDLTQAFKEMEQCRKGKLNTISTEDLLSQL